MKMIAFKTLEYQNQYTMFLPAKYHYEYNIW